MSRKAFLDLLEFEMKKSPELAEKMKKLANYSLVKENADAAFTYPKFVDSEIMADDLLKMQDMKNKENFLLYHSTTAKNKKDIEKYGLEPNVGNIVSSVYGEYNPEPLIFFNDRPSSYYSMWQANKKGNYNFKINDLAKKGHSFTTTAGNPDVFINNLPGYDPIQPVTKNKMNLDLSKYPQIEMDDYISNQQINPNFSVGPLTALEVEIKKSPADVRHYGNERGLSLAELTDLPSDKYQVELIKKLAKNKNFAFAPITAAGVEINPVNKLKELYDSYKESQREVSEPMANYLASQLDLGSKVGAPGLTTNVVKTGVTEATDPLNYTTAGDLAAIVDLFAKGKGK